MRRMWGRRFRWDGREKTLDLVDEYRMIIKISLFMYFLSILFQDGIITNNEFKDAVEKSCVGKKYNEFPQVSLNFFPFSIIFTLFVARYVLVDLIKVILIGSVG